jgi:acetyltransferase-like isoleucine patch superfamily enzyme
MQREETMIEQTRALDGASDGSGRVVSDRAPSRTGVGAAAPAGQGLPSTPAERRTFGYALRKVLADPRVLWSVLNAQIRLRRGAHVPLSVRLSGRASAGGGGRITFGQRVRIRGTTVPVEFVAWPGGQITVGDNTSINYGVSISAHELVSIGRNCLIGQYAIINDNDYHDIEDRNRLPPSAPVVLEDGVWLAARVIVLKGVRIGRDSAVSAGSVVMRDVPPRSIVAGNPARVIGHF